MVVGTVILLHIYRHLYKYNKKGDTGASDALFTLGRIINAELDYV